MSLDPLSSASDISSILQYAENSFRETARNETEPIGAAEEIPPQRNLHENQGVLVDLTA